MRSWNTGLVAVKEVTNRGEAAEMRREEERVPQVACVTEDSVVVTFTVEVLFGVEQIKNNCVICDEKCGAGCRESRWDRRS